ncbi:MULTISPECIES: universal stress protein [unclassified Streptomyces]|uniref:universal stress protein n=1 Tax=unclassified Streptomyces TaxID=2593676 RepID=UPI0004780C14|nr:MULTISPECIES: universal stress protein [unclassified Streptomyces]MYX38368.1 universal stress protein [Streptomyces sp. SID8377]
MAGHGVPGPLGDDPLPRSSTAGRPAPVSGGHHAAVDRYGVLVGYSGSATSRRALSYAAGMARRTGATLLIVHVARENPVASLLGYESAGGGVGPRGGTHTLLRQLAGEDHLSGLPWTLIHRKGAVADELEKAGRKYRANAIIVGGGRGTGSRLFRSISDRLARRARRPVIVVP